MGPKEDANTVFTILTHLSPDKASSCPPPFILLFNSFHLTSKSRTEKLFKIFDQETVHRHEPIITHSYQITSMSGMGAASSFIQLLLEKAALT